MADPNGYIIQGTLINIGTGGASSEFTADYSITALLKFDDETQMKSVARVLNYLDALRTYYTAEANDAQKAIIDTFITKRGLTDAWEAPGVGVEGAQPGDPPEQAG